MRTVCTVRNHMAGSPSLASFSYLRPPLYIWHANGTMEFQPQARAPKSNRVRLLRRWRPVSPGIWPIHTILRSMKVTNNYRCFEQVKINFFATNKGAQWRRMKQGASFPGMHAIFFVAGRRKTHAPTRERIFFLMSS